MLRHQTKSSVWWLKEKRGILGSSESAASPLWNELYHMSLSNRSTTNKEKKSARCECAHWCALITIEAARFIVPHPGFPRQRFSSVDFVTAPTAFSSSVLALGALYCKLFHRFLTRTASSDGSFDRRFLGREFGVLWGIFFGFYREFCTVQVGIWFKLHWLCFDWKLPFSNVFTCL